MNDVRHIDSALHTKYSTVNPNETIQLYEGLLEIEHNNTKISLNGIIEFVWLRSPQIKFSFVNLTPLSTNKINFDVIHLHIPNCVQPVQVRSLNSRHISNEKGQRHEYFGRVMNPICLGNGQNLNSVILHLANFHDTDGKAIKNGGKEWNGRFYLNIGDWKITIDKLENYKSLHSSLKAFGGYGITHVIKIEKGDGSQFDTEQIDDLKEELFYFFSFARGFWTEPFFEIGFDENGTEVWQKLSRPRTDKWRTLKSWFDCLRPERLSVFWLNFRKQLHDSIWGETLKRAIRWYISANQKAGDVEGSIILAQTAHEMLAWTKFVSEKGHSKKGFDNLPASDKIKLLLTEAKLPLETPSLLKFLSQNYTDGAKAIAGIRNRLVHPSPNNLRKLQQVGDEEMQDAYILTMWYLELVLLYLLGYKDEYVNRLIYMNWIGQTEKVPWI